MSLPQNLLPQPPATLLPENPEAEAAVAAALDGTTELSDAAAAHPSFSAAWAVLADDAFAEGDVIASYAYARTGYHRGLDALRRNGWKGHGPVPWSHEPNQGFLRCLNALARAAGEIGEADEAARCAQFLRDCDPAAADHI
jgi:hypothetical protein